MTVKPIVFCSMTFWVLVCCMADGAEVELKNGKTLSGFVISRPETIGNRYVLTIRKEGSFRAHQFYPERIARIKSATETVSFLRVAAPIRKAPDADAEIVRKFTPGLEVTVGAVRGDWIEVTPTAPALAGDKGWLRQDQTASEIDFSALLKQEE
jgi:hypothetical protein